jgi:enoyl-CoA hydratase/carnithine racemase
MGDLLQEHDGSIAILTLNRPAKLNALNAPMLEELAAAMEAAGQDETIRVIVLRGEGRSFCAGVDLAMVGAIRTEDEAQRHAERMAKAQAAMLVCTKPVVAAVQGHALGAGCGLVSACGFVVASSSAVFGYPETANRMLPALVTPGLVRAIGSRRAMALLLSSRRFDATEALQLGLVTMLAKNDPLPEAMELARSLAAVPVRSIEALETLARATEDAPLETVMKIAAEVNVAHRLRRHDSR